MPKAKGKIKKKEKRRRRKKRKGTGKLEDTSIHEYTYFCTI